MKVIVLLALAFVTLASTAHAEWKWEHPGVAPYAASRVDAMQKREEAFRKLGFPAQCIAPLMKETEKPGARTTLRMGDRFSAQISRGGVVHGLNEGGGVVAFKSPMLGMQYEAPAEAWTITCEGQILTASLPDVCFNWTSAISQAIAVVPVVSSGCVEISFPTRPGDTVVKFPVIGPSGLDLSKDGCTGIKRAGDQTFGPWRNEFCSTEAPILCDFSEHEAIIGQRVQLMGSYWIETHGEHVLRLPAFIAAKKSEYVVAPILVRRVSRHPEYPVGRPGSVEAYAAARAYGEQRQEWIDDNSDAIGVRWFDYENGSATVWYTQAEVPKGRAQLYWPWKEWRGRR
ncbi:MAG: hypothetical protein G01um101491_202 [Parcubacteria group bacterium Gr01-1014_91]|nr:MAG: hypothetical protein G01um101491_202 [Parcubacteria group bacterium Gr01-1014_91]